MEYLLFAKMISKTYNKNRDKIAPDYVVNAGGFINVVDELEPDGYNKERVLTRVTVLKTMVKNIMIIGKKILKPQ